MGRGGVVGAVLIAAGAVPLMIGLLFQQCAPNNPIPPATTAAMTCSWPSAFGLVLFGLPGLLIVLAGAAFLRRGRGPDTQSNVR